MNRTYPSTHRRLNARGLMRGVWAVVVLLVSAVDHYLTACIGTRPVAWHARRIASVISDAWRRGRFGPPSTCTAVEHAVFEAEFVDDPVDEATDPEGHHPDE